MTDKLFLDTNVVLDLLGEREPFYESAAKIVSLADVQKSENSCFSIDLLDR